MERRAAGQIGGRPMTPSGVSAMGVADEPEAPASARTQTTFREFYHAHVEFVWRGARRLGVDDAAVDDVVQHVFLVAHRRFPEFRLDDFPGGRGSVKAWVFAILVRVVREHRRTTRRKSPNVSLPHTDP